jgi:hypothetical protein
MNFLTWVESLPNPVAWIQGASTQQVGGGQTDTPISEISGWTIVDGGDGSNVIVQDPTTGEQVQVTSTAQAQTQTETQATSTPTSGGSSTTTSSTPTASGTAAMPPNVLLWLGALFLLWLALTALHDASAATAPYATGMAGLILVGALMYLGPTAIKNIQAIQW